MSVLVDKLSIVKTKSIAEKEKQQRRTISNKNYKVVWRKKLDRE